MSSAAPAVRPPPPPTLSTLRRPLLLGGTLPSGALPGQQQVAPAKLVVFLALLSVSLVNTGYNVLTKQVLSAHHDHATPDDFESGSGSSG
eukprot:SAG11_NODE_1107_length_5838_cov_3.543300_3_plen_90_part_00